MDTDSFDEVETQHKFIQNKMDTRHASAFAQSRVAGPRTMDIKMELFPHRSTAAALRILVADDQADVFEALRLLLKSEGFQIETAKSPATVLRAIEAREFSLVIMDLNHARDTTSGQEGFELLRAFSEML